MAVAWHVCVCVKGARIEEQRSELPSISAPTVPDEDFISLVQRFQSNRLEEQRSTLPQLVDRVPLSDQIVQASNASH